MADADAPITRPESAQSLEELFRAFEEGIGLAKDEPFRARARAALARAFVFCKPRSVIALASELYIETVKRAAGRD